MRKSLPPPRARGKAWRRLAGMAVKRGKAAERGSPRGRARRMPASPHVTGKKTGRKGGRVSPPTGPNAPDQSARRNTSPLRVVVTRPPSPRKPAMAGSMATNALRWRRGAGRVTANRMQPRPARIARSRGSLGPASASSRVACNRRNPSAASAVKSPRTSPKWCAGTAWLTPARLVTEHSEKLSRSALPRRQPEAQPAEHRDDIPRGQPGRFGGASHSMLVKAGCRRVTGRLAATSG